MLNGSFGTNALWVQVENSLFNCGVSVFVLISGYFGVKRTSFKLLFLEFSAVFYSFVGASLSFILCGGGVLANYQSDATVLYE